MSFSLGVKDELIGILGEDECCRMSELSAFVKMRGSIQISGQRLALHVVLAQPGVARKVFTLFKNLFPVQAQIIVKRKNRPKKSNSYLVRLPPQPGIKEVLFGLGISSFSSWFDRVANQEIASKDCCCRAYLRGCYLAGGFITNPSASYHLEILETNGEHAGTIVGIMKYYGLSAKVSRRRKRYVVYLKDSDHIASFLSITGAHGALLDFENVRVRKDVRNQVNRLVNCETANINKTAVAAVRQLENIKLIASTVGLESLPPTLRELVDLRVQYPDISLKELGRLMNPQVSKSGVNHRMRKMEKIAENIRLGKSGRNRGR